MVLQTFSLWRFTVRLESDFAGEGTIGMIMVHFRVETHTGMQTNTLVGTQINQIWKIQKIAKCFIPPAVVLFQVHPPGPRSHIEPFLCSFAQSAQRHRSSDVPVDFIYAHFLSPLQLWDLGLQRQSPVM